MEGSPRQFSFKAKCNQQDGTAEKFLQISIETE